MKKTRIFAPVPIRAMNDKNLTALDWRLLAVVGSHDRLQRNGRGCFAKLESLAKEADCLPSSASESLSKLVHLGYLTRYPSQKDRRQLTIPPGMPMPSR